MVSDVCVVVDGLYVYVCDGDDIVIFNLSSSAAFDVDVFGVNYCMFMLYVEWFLMGIGNEFGGIVIDIEWLVLELSVNLLSFIRVRLF